jgi:hypothetical protein
LKRQLTDISSIKYSSLRLWQMKASCIYVTGRHAPRAINQTTHDSLNVNISMHASVIVLEFTGGVHACLHARVFLSVLAHV